MKDQVFNGITVQKECVFCKYHPSNSGTVESQTTIAQHTNTAIGLLRAISFHIDEIKFGCLQGLEADIRKFVTQLNKDKL
jgi:hypothetical protein